MPDIPFTYSGHPVRSEYVFSYVVGEETIGGHRYVAGFSRTIEGLLPVDESNIVLSSQTAPHMIHTFPYDSEADRYSRMEELAQNGGKPEVYMEIRDRSEKLRNRNSTVE